VQEAGDRERKSQNYAESKVYPLSTTTLFLHIIFSQHIGLATTSHPIFAVYVII